MSEKIYSWLLKLYPAAFRDEYGAAALQLMRDRLHTERGLLARCRLWFDLIFDLAVSIPREYGRNGTRAAPQPGVYRFSEEALAARMKGWKNKLTVMICFYTAVLLGAGVGWAGGASHLPLLVTYGVLAAFGTVQYYRRTRRFKTFWRGYELIAGTDRVQQNSGRGQSVTVLKHDVTGLIDCDGGLGILTGRSRPRIMVPSDLSGYEEIREQLASWMPITTSDYRPYEGRRTSRLGYAAESLILATYVPAVLVRSENWFLPLALVSAAWIYSASSRQRCERKWMRGTVIPLVAAAPLVAHAIALLLRNS